MNAADKKNFDSIVSDVFRNFKYSKMLTTETLKRWFEALSVYTLDNIAALFNHVEKTMDAPPSLKEILDLAYKMFSRQSDAVIISDKPRCAFEKNGVSKKCKNDGLISWGKPSSEFYVSKSSLDAWDEFENNYWRGCRLICLECYESVRDKSQDVATVMRERVINQMNKINEENNKKEQTAVKAPAEPASEMKDKSAPLPLQEDLSGYFGPLRLKKEYVYEEVW